MIDKKHHRLASNLVMRFRILQDLKDPTFEKSCIEILATEFAMHEQDKINAALHAWKARTEREKKGLKYKTFADWWEYWTGPVK